MTNIKENKHGENKHYVIQREGKKPFIFEGVRLVLTRVSSILPLYPFKQIAIYITDKEDLVISVFGASSRDNITDMHYYAWKGPELAPILNQMIKEKPLYVNPVLGVIEETKRYMSENCEGLNE